MNVDSQMDSDSEQQYNETETDQIQHKIKEFRGKIWFQNHYICFQIKYFIFLNIFS
jgi:hypothetical protein